MRDNQPSHTAGWCAALRSVAHLLPPPLRLAAPDQLSGRLCGGALLPLRLLARVAPRVTSALLATGLLGIVVPLGNLQVRSRLIDDAVGSFVAAGGTQVVLLAAGMDTRAVRLAQLQRAGGAPALDFIAEVDHPATSRAKVKRLQRAGAMHDRVRFIPVDLAAGDDDALLTRLRAAGLDPHARTLVVAEGVAAYLCDEAVRRMLRTAALIGATPGSRLVWDYIERDRWEELQGRPGAALALALWRHVWFRSEPFLWHGWRSDGELAAALEECGWRLTAEVGYADAAARTYGAAAAAAEGGPWQRAAVRRILRKMRQLSAAQRLAIAAR